MGKRNKGHSRRQDGNDNADQADENNLKSSCSKALEAFFLKSKVQDFKLKSFVTVVISKDCKLRADAALQKKPIQSKNIHSRGSKSIAGNRKSKTPSPLKKDSSQSPSRRSKRKALVRALKHIRSKPVNRRGKNKSPPRISRPQPLQSQRILRKKNPATLSTNQESKVKLSRKLSRPVRFKNPLKPSKMETDGKEKDIDDGKADLSPSKCVPYKKQKGIGSDSESDSEVQMQVLEKQISSDDDDSTELSSLPTDEEGTLLSPSALTASDLARPAPIRKKTPSEGKDDVPTPSFDLPHQNYLSLYSSAQTLSFAMPTSSILSSYHTSSSSNFPSISSNFSGLSKNMSNSSFTFPSASSIAVSSSSGQFPEKRGRGRPRKASADVKSVSGKLYRKKMAERLATAGAGRARPIYHSQNQQNLQSAVPATSVGTTSYDDDSLVSLDPVPSSSETSTLATGEGVRQLREAGIGGGIDRRKNKSTFIYAKHKFLSNHDENGKFKGKHICIVCKVGFTAPSSLKRHYGTIYHKQQEDACRAAVNFSNAAGHRSGGTLYSHRRDMDSIFTNSSTSTLRGNLARGRGVGRPSLQQPKPRTSSFVRRNAVDNIKKYYAAADAARRRREGPGGGTWIQKQHRRRKPLQHSDYIYSSRDDYGDEDDEDEMGLVRDEDAENYLPDEENELFQREEDYLRLEKPSWPSNVWKGLGPPHFSCEYCGGDFSRKREFTRHIHNHRLEEERTNSLTCSDCQLTFLNETLLGNHYKLYGHGTGFGEIGSGIKPFSCGICLSAFSRLEYYRKHLESHKRPPVVCPHCSKKFSYKFYLQDHIRAMHELRPSRSANIGNGNLNGGPVLQPLSSVNATDPVDGDGNQVQDPLAEAVSSSVAPTSSSTNINLNLNPTIPPVLITTSSNRSSKNVELYCPGVPFIYTDTNKKNINSSLPSNNKEPLLVPKLEIISKSPDSNELMEPSSIYDYNFEPDNILPSRGLEELENESMKGFNPSSDQEYLKTTSPVVKEEETEISSMDTANLEPTMFAEGAGVQKTTTEDGNLVFQFQPTTFDSGFDSQNAVSNVPMTIELSRENFDVEMQMGHEEWKKGRKEVKMKKLSGSSADSSRKEVPKGGINLSSMTSTSHAGTSGGSHLPLLGCGNKAKSTTTPLASPLVCQDCGKSYEHRKSLVKHVRYYRQSEKFYCKICNKSFPLKHHVARHMKSFHSIETSSASGTEDLHYEVDFLSSPSGSNSGGILLSSAVGSSQPSSITFKGKLTGPSSTSVSSFRPSIPPRLPPFTITSKISLQQSPYSPKDNVSAPGKIRKRLESSPAVPYNQSCSSTVSISKSSSTVTVPTFRKKASSLSSESGSVSSGSSLSTTKDKLSSITVVDGMSVFKCLVCKKVYPTRHQLSTHMSYHRRSSQLPYKCREEGCKMEFKLKNELTSHEQEHHYYGPLDSSIKSPTTSLPATTNMASSKEYFCTKCPARNFLNNLELVKHMREKHLSNRKISPHPLNMEEDDEDYVEAESPDDSQLSRCPLCPLVFSSDVYLNEHMKSNHKPTQIQSCRKCGQVFDTEEEVQQHMKMEHTGEDGDDNDEDGELNEEEDEEDDDDDDDNPPTPSPHPSPIHIPTFRSGEDEDVEEEEDDDDDIPQNDDSESEELLDA